MRPGQRTGFAVLALVVLAAPAAVNYPTLEAQVLIAALLALGFNLLLGEMGFLSFGQATFNGIGAYCTGLLIKSGWPLLAALGASAGSAALAALVVGALSTQGTGIYAVMLTFAFNEMAYYAAFEWSDLTGGDNGLRGLARPALWGVGLADPRRYYYLVAAVFLVGFFLVLRLTASPFGHVLRAIRENEHRARAVGYRVRRYKVAAFALSGALSGLAGGLFAMLYQFVPLQAIDFNTSTDIVIMGLLGGTGSVYGPLLGAAVYTLIANFLSNLWARWPLILGLLFCSLVMFLRGGLWELCAAVWRRLGALVPRSGRRNSDAGGRRAARLEDRGAA